MPETRASRRVVKLGLRREMFVGMIRISQAARYRRREGAAGQGPSSKMAVRAREVWWTRVQVHGRVNTACTQRELTM
jgi:hypothetical protein